MKILGVPGIIITARKQKKVKRKFFADVLLSFIIIPCEVTVLVLAVSHWQVMFC